MEMPKPSAGHRKLEKLTGQWEGEETMYPAPWDPKGGTAVGRIHHDRYDRGSARAGKEAILTKIPLGRFGQGEDIAAAAAFLAAPEAKYITGQVLTVYGGMVM